MIDLLKQRGFNRPSGWKLPSSFKYFGGAGFQDDFQVRLRGRQAHALPSPFSGRRALRLDDIRNNDNKKHNPSHLSVLQLKLGPPNKSLQWCERHYPILQRTDLRPGGVRSFAQGCLISKGQGHDLNSGM